MTAPSRQLALPHAHRFRVAEPNGETAPAFCTLCGETKEFPTTFVGDREKSWNRDNPKRTPIHLGKRNGPSFVFDRFEVER